MGIYALVYSFLQPFPLYGKYFAVFHSVLLASLIPKRLYSSIRSFSGYFSTLYSTNAPIINPITAIIMPLGTSGKEPFPKPGALANNCPQKLYTPCISAGKSTFFVFNMTKPNNPPVKIEYPACKTAPPPLVKIFRIWIAPNATEETR